MIREPSGALIIVQERPSDPAVIVKGPFRDRKKAEVVIKKEAPRKPGAATPERAPAQRSGTVAPQSAPTEHPSATPERPAKERVMPAKPPAERPTGTPAQPSTPAVPGASKSPGGEGEREKK